MQTIPRLHRFFREAGAPGCSDGPATLGDSQTMRGARTAADLQGQGLAPATVRAYSDQIRWFSKWCESENHSPASTTERDDVLAAWIGSRFEDGVSPSTITQGIAAIRFAARNAGDPDPVGPKAAATMRGVRRAGWSRGPGQVEGMTWAQVEAAATVAARGGATTSLRDASILRLGSDGLLRVSELAAANCSDVEPQGDGSARLHIRHSKGDQEGRGETVYVGPPTWLAVRAWMAASGVDDAAKDGPLFVPVRRGGHVQLLRRMTIRSLRRIIASRARAAGIEGRISGHSLRVGSAKELVRAGADLPALMQAGRWKDAATAARYAANELAGRSAVARLRYAGASE